jgi:4-amino-4-deoxy-L-arabinose transferase-like glycosyltransferase
MAATLSRALLKAETRTLLKSSASLTLEGERSEDAAQARRSRSRRILLSGFVIFLVAFGLRLLALEDNRYEALKVQTMVTEGYRHAARLMREGGINSFFSAASPLADPNHLGHPPGYSIVMAAVNGFGGDADWTVRLVQIAADAAAAVIVFLIACELFSMTTACVAGLLVALAPQFTYNSTLLLPDTLSVLPLLLAVFCLVRAMKRPRLALLLATGALMGVSCWLRANAMMLVFFAALWIPIWFERGHRVRLALALIGGMLLVVAPLTIRNAIVYGHFIPISLGAGQTLLEGIADYDANARFGIPATDMEIMEMEARIYARPDYYGTLFNPDGILRERLRLKRGFGVIGSHPFWFAGVMLRRAAGMLRLERVHRISAEPPIAQGWTRWPRVFFNLIQRLFITAVMLPLALGGLFLLVRKRRWQTLALLLVVPAYYLCFQSMLHTEYRYVLAIHYFLFVLVAFALHAAGVHVRSRLLKIKD